MRLLVDALRAGIRRTGYEVRDARYVPKFTDRKVYDYYLSPSSEVRTIFDVGANVGQTAHAFSAAFPDAHIYSFEPFQAVYQQLVASTRGLRNVQCLQLALGNEPGTVIASVDPGDSRTSSLVQENQAALRDAGRSHAERIAVGTGVQFCAQQGITRVDILKIDVEGFELQVLDGFGDMLGPRVRAILTEFCLFEHQGRLTSLLAQCQRLGSHGYDLMSVYEIRHEADGSFHYGNALFVQREHQRRAHA